MTVKQKFDISVGWVVSLDPGTNLCGIALWRDGSLVATKLLKAEKTSDSVSKRLRDMSTQLRDFLRLHEAEVKILLSEVPPDLLLTASIGTILSTEGVESSFNVRHTVAPMTWKSFARNNGASHPDGFKSIKGIDALKAIGFRPIVDSDDIADAILVYLAYRDKYGKEKTYLRKDRPIKKVKKI